MRRAFKTLVVLTYLSGVALLSARAAASTGYPAEIQARLQLPYTPPCSYCHPGGDPDAGVGTQFGMAMVSFGLMGGNNLPSLDGALAGLEGTGSVYITDLQNGVDPNATVPPITYGCFSGTNEGRTTGPAALFLLGLGLVFLFRPRKG
jgi:MYXO-CTERM domain-containing protein